MPGDSIVDVSIREAAVEDAATISRLVSDLARKYITPDYSQEGADTLLHHLTPQAIENVMRNGTCYWVAEVSGEIVGTVSITSSRTHLYHLFVAESHQRCGLGRRLWKHIYEEVLREDHPKEFTVNSSPYAAPFYHSLGFANSGPLTEKHGVVCQPMRVRIA